MKKQLLKFSFLLFGASAVFLTSCEKEDGGEENEEEIITTMQLTFVPADGSATVSYMFDDPDGDGVNPTIDQIILAPNKTYTVAVQLLNKTVTPAEDITTEVAAEAQAHRFYYQPSGASNITVSGLNTDAAGIPLGTTSTWTTGAAATGTIRVTLRHYPGNPPNKEASDPVNSPKSATDVEVDFNTSVQ